MADKSGTNAILAIIILLVVLGGFLYFYTGGTFNFSRPADTTVTTTVNTPTTPTTTPAPTTPAHNEPAKQQ